MTVEELEQMKDDEQARQAQLENRIYCCTAAGCLSSGAERIRQALAGGR